MNAGHTSWPEVEDHFTEASKQDMGAEMKAALLHMKTALYERAWIAGDLLSAGNDPATIAEALVNDLKRAALAVKVP